MIHQAPHYLFLFEVPCRIEFPGITSTHPPTLLFFISCLSVAIYTWDVGVSSMGCPFSCILYLTVAVEDVQGPTVGKSQGW